jgi:hypothetical protein
MRAHIIRDGVVQNTVVAADIAAAQALYPDALVIEATTGGPGWFWDGTTLTPPVPEYDSDRQAAAVRADRNARLAASDWTQLADAPVDSAAWGVYRQTLRDISSQAGFPWTVEWPAEPG